MAVRLSGLSSASASLQIVSLEKGNKTYHIGSTVVDFPVEINDLLFQYVLKTFQLRLLICDTPKPVPTAYMRHYLSQ